MGMPWVLAPSDAAWFASAMAPEPRRYTVVSSQGESERGSFDDAIDYVRALARRGVAGLWICADGPGVDEDTDGLTAEERERLEAALDDT